MRFSSPWPTSRGNPAPSGRGRPELAGLLQPQLPGRADPRLPGDWPLGRRFGVWGLWLCGGRSLKRRELFHASQPQIPRPALPYSSCLVHCYLIVPTSSSLVLLSRFLLRGLFICLHKEQDEASKITKGGRSGGASTCSGLGSSKSWLRHPRFEVYRKIPRKLLKRHLVVVLGLKLRL